MIKYTTTSTKYQTSSHIKEWTEASGISESITKANLESLSDNTEIAKRLGWKYYNNCDGWWCGGINLSTMQPEKKFGQFKPDTPIQLSAEDEKPAKYITPKKEVCKYDAIALPLPEDSRYWQKIIDDPSLPISITEGVKKAGALMTCDDFPALAVAGVEMGLINGKLVNNLAAIAVQGRPVILTFDSDITTKKEVQSALKKLATEFKQKGCIVHVAVWNPELGKGIDDVLANHGPEKVKEIMANAIPYSEWLKSIEQQFKSNDSETKQKKDKPPSADAIGRLIAEDYRNRLAFNNDVLCWYRYEADGPGFWSPETDEYIESIVDKILESKGLIDYTTSYTSNVVKKLRHSLIERRWVERSDLIPFKNGVLEISTRKLLPHSPGYKLTWTLPRKHDPAATDWQIISDWLDFVTAGNEFLKNILLAFCNATLKGRADIQKFLHLMGIGGSGKGTFMQLLVNLVGVENCHTSTLEEWCGNRFETAQAYKKRLIIFPDEDKGVRSLGKFKQLTGGDWLRGEEKNKKPFKFKFEGTVAVASNFPIFGGDNSSGLARRLISVPFNAVVSQSKRRDLNEAFQPYLAAFTNHLLTLSDEWVSNTLRGLVEVPEVSLQFWESKIREDSVAGFLNDKLIYDPMAQTSVGDSSEAHGSLYQAYYAYCQAQGHKPQAIKNFSPNLIETAGTILNWKVEKNHTKIGKTIRGLRLRVHGQDDYLPTYDSELFSRCFYGDGSSDGSVTDTVTGQDTYSVNVSAKVTDKPSICCEKSESVLEVAKAENKQNFESEESLYPSPESKTIPDKNSDPSPHPSPHPSLKEGDRAKIIEDHPLPERRNQEVEVIDYWNDDDGRGDMYKVQTAAGEKFTLSAAKLLPLPLPKFEIGQRVKVKADYPQREQYRQKTGTIAHVLDGNTYKVRFDRAVKLMGAKKDIAQVDFDAKWLEAIN